MINEQKFLITLSDIEPLYYYIGAALLSVIIIIVVIVLTTKKKPKKQVDMDFILTLFNKENILNVAYIRNKIVMDFKDVELVDVQLLHEKGAKGVSIIGDRIKFYFDGGEERNKSIYDQIKNVIEG